MERAVKAAKKASRRPERKAYAKDCPDMAAAARCFWEAYLLSLCGHMERLTEHADKEQERQALHGSIQTVQAVLYALQETEQTERNCLGGNFLCTSSTNK